MSWKWAAFLPHPPIIVPEIGRGKEDVARATIDGYETVVSRIAKSGSVDAVLILSPHQPYFPMNLMLNTASRYHGSFAAYGAPDVDFELEGARGELESLSAFIKSEAIPAAYGAADDLSSDQGSMVPLYFLGNELGGVPPAIFANPIGLPPDAAVELGLALAEFDDGREWGLIASGDLSHRLKHDGPNGYSPCGMIFDNAVVDSLRANDPSRLLALDGSVVEGAGECGAKSALVMLGLVLESSQGDPDAIDVVSYEGPFGVGYCTAVWVSE